MTGWDRSRSHSFRECWSQAWGASALTSLSLGQAWSPQDLGLPSRACRRLLGWETLRLLPDLRLVHTIYHASPSAGGHRFSLSPSPPPTPHPSVRVTVQMCRQMGSGPKHIQGSNRRRPWITLTKCVFASFSCLTNLDLKTVIQMETVYEANWYSRRSGNRTHRELRELSPINQKAIDK